MNGFADISLMDLAKIMRAPYKVRLGEKLYDNLDEAMESLEGKHSVKTIAGKDIVIDINQVSKGV